MNAMLTLTDAAVAHARALLDKTETPVAGLRVGVRSRGCSGYSYYVEYAEEQKPLEDVVEAGDVRIFVDPMATMFIIGAEMDYTEDRFHSGFVFSNPNESGRCGCGESFSVNAPGEDTSKEDAA